MSWTAAPLLTLLMFSAPALAQDTPSQQDAELEEAPLVKVPELLEFVQAPYPPEAEAQGLEAQVMLLIEIDETGKVVLAEVLEPVGHGFDEAAVAAAQQFVFSPAEDEIGPLGVVLEFAYGFQLAPEPPPEPEDGEPEVSTAPVNLEGVLVEMGTRRPLSEVPVWVMRGSERMDTVTDADGSWSFRGVPAGPVTVSAAYPGYDQVDTPVDVVEGEVTALRLWIRNRDYSDDAAVGVYEVQREPDVTRRTISIQEVRRVPGTFGDPVRIIQSLPGAARPSFGTSQLILRGANPEDSNVYIDSVEVPIIYHLGGYRSVINPGLIAAVDYYPGGYGVRYGRSTGGVVDIRTSDDYPERFELQTHADFLDASVFTRGQVGKEGRKVGVAAGVRRSYLDVLIKPILPDNAPSIKPRWFDYQLKAESQLDGPDQFSLLLFGFQDLLLINNPAGFSEGGAEDGEDGLSTVYQTHRLVGTWRRELGPDAEFTLRPMVGWDDVQLELGTDTELLQRDMNLGLRSELRWQASPAWRMTAGFDGLMSRYTLDLSIPDVPASDDPLAESETFTSEEGGWRYSPDPYLDAQWRPLQDRDKMVWSFGARANTLLESDADALMELDPRVSMNWEVIPGGTLKAGTGIFQQSPPIRALAFLEGGNLKMERAWSSEIGWKQRFGSFGSVDVTTFYKKMDRIGVFNPDLVDPLNDPFFVSIGEGRVLGLEVLARKDPVGPLFGWISYTLSQSERQDGDGEWYKFDYDQTHILTAVAGYRLPYDFDLSARFQYATGNPYTPYDGAVFNIESGSYDGIPSDSLNSKRLPAYYALDLRASKKFTFKRWQLEAFIDVLNTVHGDNPEFIIYNYDFTESTYVLGLPIVPSLGFDAEFTF